jgi:iron complex outermembrane recepter protein
MYRFLRLLPLLLCMVISHSGYAQAFIKGKIIDASTKEPITGVSILCTQHGCNMGCATNANGEFEMHCPDCQKFSVSCVGYISQQISIDGQPQIIFMMPSNNLLNEVVVSANRGERVKRSEAPIAISLINAKALQDAKPATIDQVLNKVSGVNMVNLGNEQHQMSIRQPMTTKGLFLYLEDGIPIRTTGLYNHNALLEINMANVRNIEVIKGPSSSLYGSEAIGGVVNFITLAPTAVPVLKLSAQANDNGYKRMDLQSSISSGKWGFVLSGYHADKINGYLPYSDYNKNTISARMDYHFSEKTTLSNSITWLNYFSDMPGGIDSAMFASKTFINMQTFTYRKVNALRYRSSFIHDWENKSKTTISILYRDNTIGQNPAYRIKDDYRRQGNSFIGKKDLAHGEINASSFNSYSFIAQHKQNIKWKKAVIIGGINVDASPSAFTASYIRIQKDTLTKKYISYQSTDSVLTDYATRLNNYAAFINVELSPVEKLRLVASLRYDLFRYNFDNHLTPSAFSGSPDIINHFSRISPKIGFTYNTSNQLGFYANYSEGFVPPQVTEMYTGVKVPELHPSIFYNYEIGGWIEIIKNKFTADVSAYKMIGTNEIISVRLDDGSFANQNAGKTSHKGIELGVNATLLKDLTFRLSGAYSQHRFLNYTEKGIDYNGNEMNNAPHWMYNTELWYRPSFINKLRIGAEWQHIGSYYADPKNTAKYSGYNVLNLRFGYQVNAFEVWMNVLNATNNYYSTITTKSAYGYSYQLADPRNFNLGISYDFAKLFKKK